MAKEKPAKERREYKRTKNADTAVSFDGGKYSTRNLSIGGALIDGYDGPLSAGSLFYITGIGPAGGNQSKVMIHARINRVLPETGQIALQFLSLDDTAYDILLNIMAGRIDKLE